MNKCKNCGASSFVRINSDTIECKYCGVQRRNKRFKEDNNLEQNDLVLEHEEFCNNPQAHIEEKKKKDDKKSFTLVKLLLCIFLGYLGVHKFVEGKPLAGIVYLFTYGLFGIGVLCDIISIAKELGNIGGEDKK